MTLRAAAASCARSAVCKCFPEAALLRAFPESCLQRLRGRVRRCLRTAFPGAEMRLGGTLSRGETRSRPLSPGSCSEDVGVTAGRDRDFDGTRHGSSRHRGFPGTERFPRDRVSIHCDSKEKEQNLFCFKLVLGFISPSNSSFCEQKRAANHTHASGQRADSSERLWACGSARWPDVLLTCPPRAAWTTLVASVTSVHG